MNNITVNGKGLEIEEGTTILSLVQGKKLVPEAVVVERNATIVDRSQWANTALRNGDSIEIVHFVGGG